MHLAAVATVLANLVIGLQLCQDFLYLDCILEHLLAFGHNSENVEVEKGRSMIIGEDALAIIRGYEPQVRPEESLLKAAVAIILRDTEHGTECLMMQRAKHERDPWSGQMSFPGGKIDPEDADAKAAAIREAMEEVGADLSDEDYIGQLDDLYGLRVDGIFSVHVACFVFKPQRALALVANHEVADMVWLPLKNLERPDMAHDFKHPSQASLSMPAVMIDQSKEQILWGLSLRMLANMYELLGRAMTVLSDEQHQELRGIEHRELDPQNLDRITQKIVDRR